MIFPELCAQDEVDEIRALEHQANILDAQVNNLKEQIERLKKARKFGLIPQSRSIFVTHSAGHFPPSSWMQKMKPPQVIVHFLKQQDSPISQRVLKKQILNEGYPAEKFGKNGVYFYVILDRLKKRGKLEKEGDEVRLLA